MGRILASWSIRRKLVLFLSIIFVPVTCSILITGINERREEIAKAQHQALLVVQGLVGKQEQVAITTRTLLDTLARLHEVQSIDGASCSKLFRELHDQYPFYSIIMAATPDGKAFASSVPIPGRTDLSDRLHFKEAIRTRDFSAGEYIVGRVTRLKSLNFAFPVLDARKRVVAVLMAGFNLDEYGPLVSKANLPEGYAVVITDRSGKRLFRLPGSDAFPPGTPLPVETMNQISGGGPDQGYYALTAQDGVRRVYAFGRVRLRENDPPYLYMIVGMPKDTILHQGTLRMARNLSILGVAAIIALGLAWIFGRVALVAPLDRFVAALRRFGGGEMDARTGLPHTADEFGRLARSFDDMASLVKKRSIERESAEKALIESHAELERRIEERTADLSAVNVALTAEIAERKKAEAYLKESEERYRVAIESSNDGVTIARGDERIYANQRFLDMFGYSREEVVGKDVTLIIHPDDREMIRDDNRKRQRGESAPSRFEFRGIRKDGTEINVETSVAGIMYLGQPAILAYQRDVTERKNLEEQLRQAQKMEAVGTLAGGVAHDFNNILTVIMGFANLIQMSMDKDDRFKEYVDQIAAASIRAADLSKASSPSAASSGSPWSPIH